MVCCSVKNFFGNHDLESCPSSWGLASFMLPSTSLASLKFTNHSLADIDVLLAATTVSELMAKVEKILNYEATAGNSISLTTGKQWSSGDSMADEVSKNETKYLGGKSCWLLFWLMIYHILP